MRRRLIALLCIPLAIPIALPATAAAASTIVQQASTAGSIDTEDGGIPAISLTVPANVSAGDVMVVGVATGGVGLPTITDSLGTTYALAVSSSTDGKSSISTATLSASGADTITATWSCSDCVSFVALHVFELAGVTMQGAATGTGSGGPSFGVVPVATGSVAFQPGAVLIALNSFFDVSAQCQATIGAGFTGRTVGFSAVEYATSGVSSPTTFPMTVGGICEFWAEVGIALPSSAPATHPVGLGGWRNNQAATTAHLPQSLDGYAVDSWSKAKAVFDASNCGKAKGDAVNCLAGQLLTAKLNVANGSDACVAGTVSSADTFLAGVPYAGPSTTYKLSKTSRSTATGLQSVLEAYNRGAGCP